MGKIKNEMPRRNDPIMKSVESAVRPEDIVYSIVGKICDR